MNKSILWAVVLILIIIAGALVFVAPRLNDENPERMENPQTNSSQQNSSAQIDKEQLILGQPDAEQTIVEYGDYKCPTCGRFHAESYVELKRQYLDTGEAKIVFRNLPRIAEDSYVAAEGAYCANEQNLFEEYHNGVYEHMNKVYASEGIEREFDNILTTELLSQIITDSGGAKQKFVDCLNSKKHRQAVDDDLRLAEQDGASGTPTFIIDDQKIVGAQPITVFKTLLQD